MNSVQVADEKMDSIEDKSMSLKKMFFLSSGLALVIAAILLVISFAIFALFQFRKYNLVTSASGLPLTQIISEFRQGWKQEPVVSENKKNILVLGLDSLETRTNDPKLTDSLLIASLNFDTGKISLLSIPRDLWVPEYQTKINALYVYGQDRYPEEPERFSREVVSDLTGLEIHHTVVLSMESLSNIVDALGGITVDVPVAFVDESFPDPNVDIHSVTDPDLLYKTIEFSKGEQEMNGERVLEYVRSRHSGDDSGNDNDRTMRQRLVIESIISKATSREVLTDPQIIGNLTDIYVKDYQSIFPISELAASAKAIMPHRSNIEVINVELPIFPEDELGIITHPPLYNNQLYNGQWVYIIRDNQLFEEYVSQKLGHE